MNFARAVRHAGAFLSGALLLLATCVTAAADESARAYPPPAVVKAAFLKQLDRAKVPLDAQTRTNTVDADGRGVETVSIASERKADGAIERVPLLIVRPPILLITNRRFVRSGPHLSLRPHRLE
jgi:hypothetical protein